MKTVTPSDSDDHKQSSTKRHWKIGGSTPPRAVTWLTWPILFTFNIGLAMRAIMQHGNYSSVLTTLLITDVVVLVTLESLFPVQRQWKMTWRSFRRDLKYIVAGGATFAVIDGVFGLASIRLNTGHVGPITNWPLYLSVPVALMVHHSASLSESKNYAVTLSFLDIIFGTFYYRPGSLPERLGVVDPSAYPNSNEFWQVMRLPFEGELEQGFSIAPVADLR